MKRIPGQNLDLDRPILEKIMFRWGLLELGSTLGVVTVPGGINDVVEGGMNDQGNGF